LNAKESKTAELRLSEITKT